MARVRPGVRIRGLEIAARKIELLARVGGEELVSGMRVIGEEIMTDVKASRPGAGIPKDEGTLAGSGRVTGPKPDDVVRVSFGGAAAPYALKQHEELQYRHALGEARYLVRALERWARGSRPVDALRRVAKATVAKVAGRGGDGRLRDERGRFMAAK
jgi:hypothetical protein